MQSLVLDANVALSEDELSARIKLHRGVYCRPGKLLPTANTIYHMCAAEDFNATLPFGAGPGGRSYAPPTFAREGFIHACRTLEDLHGVANRFYTGDRRHYYVMQIDAGELTATVVDEGPIHPPQATSGGVAQSEEATAGARAGPRELGEEDEGAAPSPRRDENGGPVNGSGEPDALPAESRPSGGSADCAAALPAAIMVETTAPAAAPAPAAAATPPPKTFPHIYGRVNVEAISRMWLVARGPDGAFVRVTAPTGMPETEP